MCSDYEKPGKLLHKRGTRSIEIDPSNFGSSRKHTYILTHCLFLDVHAKPLGNLLARDLERQWFTGNALVNRYNMEPVACLYDIAEDPGRAELEDSLFELRDSVPPAELSKVAALLT